MKKIDFLHMGLHSFKFQGLFLVQIYLPYFWTKTTLKSFQKPCFLYFTSVPLLQGEKNVNFPFSMLFLEYFAVLEGIKTCRNMWMNWISLVIMCSKYQDWSFHDPRILLWHLSANVTAVSSTQVGEFTHLPCNL